MDAHVIILPWRSRTVGAELHAAATELEQELLQAGICAHADLRDAHKPEWRLAALERTGVHVVIRLGIRDVARRLVFLYAYHPTAILHSVERDRLVDTLRALLAARGVDIAQPLTVGN